MPSFRDMNGPFSQPRTKILPPVQDLLHQQTSPQTLAGPASTVGRPNKVKKSKRKQKLWPKGAAAQMEVSECQQKKRRSDSSSAENLRTISTHISKQQAGNPPSSTPISGSRSSSPASQDSKLPPAPLSTPTPKKKSRTQKTPRGRREQAERKVKVLRSIEHPGEIILAHPKTNTLYSSASARHQCTRRSSSSAIRSISDVTTACEHDSDYVPSLNDIADSTAIPSSPFRSLRISDSIERQQHFAVHGFVELTTSEREELEFSSSKTRMREMAEQLRATRKLKGKDPMPVVGLNKSANADASRKWRADDVEQDCRKRKRSNSINCVPKYEPQDKSLKSSSHKDRTGVPHSGQEREGCPCSVSGNCPLSESSRRLKPIVDQRVTSCDASKSTPNAQNEYRSIQTSPAGQQQTDERISGHRRPRGIANQRLNGAHGAQSPIASSAHNSSYQGSGTSEGKKPSQRSDISRKPNHDDWQENFLKREVDVFSGYREKCKCSHLPDYFRYRRDRVSLKSWGGSELEFMAHIGQVSTCPGHPPSVIDSCTKILRNFEFKETNISNNALKRSTVSYFPTHAARAQSSIAPFEFYGQDANSTQISKPRMPAPASPANDDAPRHQSGSAQDELSPVPGSGIPNMTPPDSCPSRSQRLVHTSNKQSKKLILSQNKGQTRDSIFTQRAPRLPRRALQESSFNIQRTRHMSVPAQMFSQRKLVSTGLTPSPPTRAIISGALQGSSGPSTLNEVTEKRLTEIVEKAVRKAMPAHPVPSTAEPAAQAVPASASQGAPTAAQGNPPVTAEGLAAQVDRPATAAQGNQQAAATGPAARRPRKKKELTVAEQAERALAYPEFSADVPVPERLSDNNIIGVGKLSNPYKRHKAAPYTFRYSGRLRPQYEYLLDRREGDGLPYWTRLEERRLSRSRLP